MVVPQGDREADPLMAIADSCQAVLVPPIGPRPGMVMGKVIPRGPSWAVVFAHGAPGAFAEVRTPALPMLCSLTRFLEADSFSREGRRARSGCRLRLASFRHSGSLSLERERHVKIAAERRDVLKPKSLIHPRWNTD